MFVYISDGVDTLNLGFGSAEEKWVYGTLEQDFLPKFLYFSKWGILKAQRKFEKTLNIGNICQKIRKSLFITSLKPIIWLIPGVTENPISGYLPNPSLFTKCLFTILLRLFRIT